jgi:hypothetical protein
MFQRLIVLFMTIAALMAFSAPAALAQPPATIGQVPPGFPSELKQYVGGTKEFLDAPWFHGACKDRGGDVGAYINAVMFQEPRLLYWSTPPEARKAFWITDPLNIPPNIDVNKEPPNLPKTFPAVVEGREAYTLRAGSRYCADTLKQWTNPATNAWGFTWASAPDAESLEAMKKHASTYLEDTIDKFTNACGEGNAPYCQKAFFLDCSRTAMNPEKKQDCIDWNFSVAQLFTGLTKFIDDNTSWLEKIGQFFGMVGEAIWTGGKVIVEAFIGIVKFAINVVKFIANPGDAIDDMANSLHGSAVDFTTKVLQGLAGIGNFDPSSPWFLTTYAASTGLGLVVMAFMAILMIARTASGGGGREDLQEALVKHLPIGVFLMVFAPAIGAVLGEAVNGLTNGIAAWDAGFLTNAVAKLALLGSVTSALIPGGAFIGLLLFLLMVIGAFAVFVGLAMQSIALPLSAVVAGLAWGMWVHPKWRRKALKVPLTYVGVLFSKPLLFFLLGVIFALIDGNLSEPAMKAGGIPLLTQIVLVIVALIVAGFAPFSLLKYAPLLPTAADSHDSQPSPGFGTSAVVGAAVGGGGRGAGGGGGGSQPAASTGGGDGGQHSIQQTYSQQQNKPNEQPQPRTSSPVTAGTGGSGGGAGQQAGQQQVGKAAATSGAGTGAATTTAAGTAGTAGTAAATVGTGVATGGMSVVAQAGAQVGAAAINKTRQAAHNRHLPELDDDATREE